MTHFKITGISNGTLYKNDGTTQISNGTFITFAEGNAGLKFTPTANFNGSGSFTVQASTANGDAGLGGSTVVATITVNAVNDAPVLDNTRSPALTAQNEDSGAPSGAVGTLVSTLVDFTSPAGQVDNVSEVDSGALLGIAVTAADTTNGAWWYSTDNGASWNALGAVANNNARLLAADANTRLYFQPNANYSGTLASALTFRAWDQTSGTSGTLADTTSNGGTTAFSTATDTASLVVNAVNDAPVLDNTKSPALTAQNEDSGAPSGAVGTLVSALVDLASPAGQVDNVSEVDSGALLGIAVTAADTTNGAWWYSTNNGASWNALGAVADNNARLLAADANTRLYFQPNANYQRHPGQRPHLPRLGPDQRHERHPGRHHQQRRYDGLLHGHRHRQPGDQPGGRHAVGDQCHDQRGHADDQRAGAARNAADGAEVTHFKITGISNGTLYKNDGTTPISNGTFITFAEGNAGLKFTPTANFNGSGSFTVQASTANGDAGLGGSTVVATITVNAVNDAPVLDNTKSPALTAQNEDSGAPSGAVGTLVSALVDLASPAGQVDNVSEVDSGALLGIAVTAADTTNGAWWYSTNNGASWNALGAVANNNARLLAADANTRLYFQPNANYSGTLASALTFRAWDQTSGTSGTLADTTSNGGTTAFSTATDTASLVINPVADTPSVTNATTNEDTQTTSGLVLARNAADGAEVTHFKITGISNGTLYKNDGTTQISNGTFITFAEGNAGLKFTPTANFNGSGSFTVQASTANGDAGLGGSTVVATITVNAVNDAPVLDNTRSPALTAQNEDSGAPPARWAHWFRPWWTSLHPRDKWTTSARWTAGRCWGSPSRRPTRPTAPGGTPPTMVRVGTLWERSPITTRVCWRRMPIRGSTSSPTPTTAAPWPAPSPSAPGTRPAARAAPWPTPPATAVRRPSPPPPTPPAWWSMRSMTPRCWTTPGARL